ncbi:MAG: hypothetical protein ACQEQ0_06825 [Bacteroidota bacterium]
MKKQFLITIVMALTLSGAYGQQFEESKLSGEEFTEVTPSFGADFALQYQSLDHSADAADLIPLGTGINLPTANFNLEADLAPGIMVNLQTYLSSRHHTETWVKGGYLLMDQMPFLNFSAIDNVMEYLTIKVGVMELNYGDAHFRRSDNAEVVNNPFVGNYIMDAFTTAPAAEFLIRSDGWLAMAALTGGALKPELVTYNGNSDSYQDHNIGDELAFYWKAGFDKEISETARLRATISGYHNSQHHFGSLYTGDRAGSRYYLVMQEQTGSSEDVNPASGHTTGRWGPGFTDENNSYMLNLFGKLGGLEVFGTYETTSGTSAFSGAEYNFDQVAIEGIYRFGREDNFFAAARINNVSNDNDMSVDRMQLGAGWFMTSNIITKLEYVDQTYNDFEYGNDAGFNGIMLEAGISF